MRFTLAILLVSGLAATAQQKITVEGSVTAVTGEPIRRPTVRLEPMGAPFGQAPMPYMVTGDESGKFVIDDVAPGSYTLTATKAGFLAGRYGARSPGGPGATMAVRSGSVRDLTVKLTPQGTVSGRATNADGDPVERANVALYPSGFVRGKRGVLDGRLSGPTNDKGEFKIENVPPGRYYVRVITGNLAPDPKTGLADQITYYPNAPDLGAAIAVNVTAGGRNEGIDIRIVRERAFTVQGKATVDGTPVPDATVLAWRKVGIAPGTPTGYFVRPQRGAFKVPEALVPGEYTLEVSGRSTGPGMTGEARFTVKDRNIDNLALTLRPGIELSGVFKVDDGHGNFTPPASAARVGVQPPDQNLFPSVNTRTDGSFKLQAVSVGKYLLNVSTLPRGTYIKSVHYGVQDVTRSMIDLVEGGGTLEIILSAKAATVAGAVRNDQGEGIPGVMVTAWPKNVNPGTVTGGIVSVYSDQSGGFSIGGLEPGEYSVVAWDEIDPGLTQVPAFLAAFASQAEAAKVDEGSQVSVAVKMIPKDRVLAESAKLP